MLRFRVDKTIFVEFTHERQRPTPSWGFNLPHNHTEMFCVIPCDAKHGADKSFAHDPRFSVVLPREIREDQKAI